MKNLFSGYRSLFPTRKRHARRHMRIEPLEPRMLLSAITSNGTELQISLDSTEVALAFAPTPTGDVSIIVDGVAVATFAPDAVDRVVIYGNDLNNNINLSGIPQGAIAQAEIYGGAGDDFVVGSMAPDLIILGDGDDIGAGGGQSDTVQGNAGNDTLMGNGSPDILQGGTGDDDLNGQAAVDTCDGGTGGDIVHNDGTDVITAVTVWASGEASATEDEIQGRFAIHRSDATGPLIVGVSWNTSVNPDDSDFLIADATDVVVVATAAIQFIGTSGTVSFANGEYVVYIDFDAMDDGLDEVAETLYIKVDPPNSGAQPYTPNNSDSGQSVFIVDKAAETWKRKGNTDFWVAMVKDADLHDLAKKITQSEDDWTVIWPVSTAPQIKAWGNGVPYPKAKTIGALADAGNLYGTGSKKANLVATYNDARDEYTTAMGTWITTANNNPKVAFDGNGGNNGILSRVKALSGEGATPISYLSVVMHTPGDQTKAYWDGQFQAFATIKTNGSSSKLGL